MWFFDTWAPQDGIAFASRRGVMPDYDPEHSKPRIEWLKQIERTVSLLPPNWEPVDVRPSTALRAERSGFQRGLFSSQAEVSFPSLEQVIEAVRRGYVASGGDADEGPVVVDDEPLEPQPPDDQEPDGQALVDEHQENELAARGLQQLIRGLGVEGVDQGRLRLVAPEDVAPTVVRFLTLPSSNLEKLVVRAARDVTALFLSRVKDKRNHRFLPSFFAWASIMIRGGFLGPWNSPLSRKIRSVWPDDLYPYDFLTGPGTHPPLLTHHVPMPPWACRRSPNERLIDQLLWVLSSSGRWPALDAEALACGVLGACLVRGQQRGHWAWLAGAGARRRELLSNALSWLLRELPAPFPNNAAATQALNGFAEKQTNS